MASSASRPMRHATLAAGIGAVAALILWPAYALIQGPLYWPFVAALGLSCAGGTAILALATLDLMTVTRSRRVRPARAFDLLLGLGIAVPAGAALMSLLA
ncbi:hypothetical protein GVO57_05130 [Sphingomonas changnyeongensis]|uniref:Uncharacterized protein n=1 Tax=Sphingomonas changnyeongensis TaxID=2698679 RepID=A0A7Z2S7G9_9SPHN|nr:hypothetical protein [Sphingomonas changnyeongensis]QHL90331.1 hypothetical protein GVO57_05130 [Sphingomonas changnyeongensis]